MPQAANNYFTLVGDEATPMVNYISAPCQMEFFEVPSPELLVRDKWTGEITQVKYSDLSDFLPFLSYDWALQLNGDGGFEVHGGERTFTKSEITLILLSGEVP